MAELLNIVFRNGAGFTVDADIHMNPIVNRLNEVIAEVNAIANQTADITRSKELVRAYKANAQTLNGVGTGQENVITGWTAEKNVGSILNVTTGLITLPEAGTYRIEGRSFVSINNATRVRAKYSISGSGAELAKSDASQYGTASSISNYRQDFYTFAQTAFGQGSIVSFSMRVWDAASGSIPVESSSDTFLVVSRIY